MSQNRFIALLVILSIVAILVASNWSVVLPLSFLGIQTRSLPVGIWLLLGFATGLGITFLLQLIRLLGAGKIDRDSVRDRPPRKSPRPPQRRTTTSSSDRQNQPQADAEEDDWDVEPPPKSEDWDFDEEEEPQDRPRSYSQPDYETKQEPTSKNVSGSVYSYSYRQPHDTGVGQSEAVRDANYRVITPPAREPVESTVDEDDWGFDFDDEERR